MRRKDPLPVNSTSRGKSLIATRTNQQQQRKMQSNRSPLPRSYSSPATQHESDSPLSQTTQKGYIMRSFSTPEPKNLENRRNSDSFYRPRMHGSRGELDSDLENFENFEEGFLDIDADHEVMFAPYRNVEILEPKKVVTSLLPGSGLQKVTIRPISSTTQTRQSARETMNQLKMDQKGKMMIVVNPLAVIYINMSFVLEKFAG